MTHGQRSGESVLVIGATSGIGRALCHRLAREGQRLVIAGRNREELERITSDLRLRYGTEVDCESFDALDFDSHPGFLNRCLDHLGGQIDGAVICHGYSPNAGDSQREFAVARRTLDVNFNSVVSLLTPIANHMEARGSGWIAVISSVAGDRGRQSNYVYGSAKGALSIFLQGLRNRLHPRGVHVLTIKPGFVDTPMLHGTAAADSRLTASPERVAADIHTAILRRRDVLYTPWFWRPIMSAIRHIPERFFKRLRL